MGGSGCVILELSFCNCLYRCFSSGALALCHAPAQQEKTRGAEMMAPRKTVIDFVCMCRACSCVAGNRDSPLTWQSARLSVLDN